MNNGQYAVEMVAQDPQSHRQTAYVLTPIIASLQPHEVQPTVAPPTWLTARVRQWPFEYLVTLQQDSVDLSRAQALAFQFQLPGQSETWLDGATAPVGSPTAQTCQLSVKGPRLLPVVQGLHKGVAASGCPRRAWKSCGGSVPPSAWSRRCWTVLSSVVRPPAPPGVRRRRLDGGRVRRSLGTASVPGGAGARRTMGGRRDGCLSVAKFPGRPGHRPGGCARPGAIAGARRRRNLRVRN